MKEQKFRVRMTQKFLISATERTELPFSGTGKPWEKQVIFTFRGNNYFDFGYMNFEMSIRRGTI